MIEKEILEIIEKYYDGVSTSEEENILYAYFAEAEISPALLQFADEFRAMSAFKLTQQKMSVELPFKPPIDKPVYARLLPVISKAAILIGLIAIGYIAGRYKFQTDQSPKDLDLTQLSLSEWPSERIDLLKTYNHKKNINKPDLAVFALLLKYDPDENVRLGVIRLLNENISDNDIQSIIVDALGYQQSELVLHNLLDIILDNDIKKAAAPLVTLTLEASYSDHLIERMKDAAEKIKSTS